MTLKVSALALALAIGTALIVPATPALGHANYSSSTPGFGAIVTTAPTQVDAFFTQDLNLAGTNSLNVLGPSSNDVDNNNMTIDSGNHKHMVISLQGGLAYGTYTVEWTTTSAVDGHTGNGSFPFQYLASVGGTTNLSDIRVTGIDPTSGSGLHAGLLVAGFATVLALIVTGGAAVYVAKRS